LTAVEVRCGAPFSLGRRVGNAVVVRQESIFLFVLSGRRVTFKSKKHQPRLAEAPALIVLVVLSIVL